jgi:anti-sigma regulatory factor (Ser/Thr protein kinase)
MTTSAAIDSPVEFAIRADPNELRRASAWLEQVAQEHCVPQNQVQRLELCLNEALANVITHGGTGAQASPIALRFDMYRMSGIGQAAVTVCDSGIAFDPLAAQPKPRPLTLAEAEPGGLGLAMMRSFADELSYRRSEGRNRFTFGVRWTETQQ